MERRKTMQGRGEGQWQQKMSEGQAERCSDWEGSNI